MAENTNTEREAFESALIKLCAGFGEEIGESDLDRTPSGAYVNGSTEVAWMLWQARASLAAKPLPAAVPVVCNRFAWGRLYDKASILIAVIGRDGELSSRAEEVALLMDALHDIDGGEHMPGLMPAAQFLNQTPSAVETSPGAPNFEGGAAYEAFMDACALAAPQPAVAAGWEFPALTPELAKILGTMCFQCITFAQALRQAGHQINTRAEDEQAATLHWMLGHYFRHGEGGWRQAAMDEMERMRAAALPPAPSTEGESNG